MTTIQKEQLGWTSGELQALGAVDLRDLYRLSSVLQVERERVFAKSWTFVGSSSELAITGAYLTATVGNSPVVVLRDDEGVVRAFHNLCRHRSITLVAGRGQTGRFLTCPYHQWSYGLTGELVRVPQQQEQFPGIECGTLGLLPVAVEEWHGMIFVNLDSDAIPLTESMAGLDHRLDGFLRGPLVEVGRMDYEVACNWKFIVENHVDVYHLWYLHSRTLREYDHRRMVWESLGNNWWSLDPLKDPDRSGQGFDLIDSTQREGLGAHLLYPNLMIITTNNYFATYDATPIAPDRTRLTLRIRALEGTDSDAIIESISSFLSEDLVAGERLQQAAESPAFALGPLALGHEQPLRSLHVSLRQDIFR